MCFYIVQTYIETGKALPCHDNKKPTNVGFFQELPKPILRGLG